MIHLIQALVVSLLYFSSTLHGNAVRLTSDIPIFEDEVPIFKLEASEATPELLGIQIATHPEFLNNDLFYEEIDHYDDTYTLTPLVTKSLENRGEHFIRFRVKDCGGWSDWSEPGSFLIERAAAYSRPGHIKEEVWSLVEPYLLPEDHPIRPVLDKIFSESRVILSTKSMIKAGFIDPKPRKWTHLIVTKHPDVPGYVFKVYLDAQRNFKGKRDYEYWLKRIEGVLMIQTEIEKRGWQKDFKTPKKWIYALPEEPSPPKEFKRKNFILVEEDMDIYDKKSNYDMWKSDVVTKEKLDAFYILCEELGLHDCAKPDNAPFSKDGKISFIDTETYYHWPVLYKKMTPFLSKEMQAYWKKLTKKSRK